MHRRQGLNNERCAIELAFAMAFVWGRTLVLPPIAGNPSVMSSHFVIGPPHHLWWDPVSHTRLTWCV
jgi:hypothetical protein